jgi:hypothetical protein
MLLGLIVVLIGALIYLSPRLPFLEKMPLNIHWHRGPMTLYVPVGFCIIVSVLATILLHFIGRR